MRHDSIQVHRLSLLMSVAYLIESKQSLILVDAGIRGEEGRILAAISRLKQQDLRLIYLTHAHLDHYGSAAAIRRATGAPIAIHEVDAPAMAGGETRLGQARGKGKLLAALLPLVHPLLRPEPAEADILLRNDQHLESFGFELLALYTPGHTMGSTCLIADGRLGFSGDLVTTTGGPHLQRSFAQDWDLVPTSLRLLQNLDLEWIYPGHGQHPLTRQGLQRLGS